MAYKDIDRITYLGLKIVRQAVEDLKCTGSNGICCDYCPECKETALQFLTSSELFSSVLESCGIELTPGEYLKEVGFNLDGQHKYPVSGKYVESFQYRLEFAQRSGTTGTLPQIYSEAFSEARVPTRTA